MSAASKRLIIATVFAPSKFNLQWYTIQKQFIQKTTTVPFDYWVVLNGVSQDGFERDDIVIVNDASDFHSEALMELLERFRRDRREAYLLLDSDCFPVRRGWYQILREQMRTFGKVIAAPVRTENLDLFPHPSAVFMLDRALDDPRLDFRKAQVKNLLGQQVYDTGATMQSLSEDLLPLLRTNIVNVHPVAAAVYHHLFYHHGAGSRDFNFRVLKRFRYCEHWYNIDQQQQHGDVLHRAFMEDPQTFIERLMGEEEHLIRSFLNTSALSYADTP